MSLPAPSYAIQVDPRWNNVPVDAVEVVAAGGSPVTDQEVILWDTLTEKDQQTLLDVVDDAGGWPVADLSTELNNAHANIPSMTIPSVYPRPAAPINTNDAYYDGSWKKVYDDTAA